MMKHSKDILLDFDPCLTAVYIEYFEDFVYIIFNDGLDVFMPYPIGKDGKVVEMFNPIEDVYYRRN